MLRAGVLFCLIGLVLCTPPVSRSRSQIEAFREALEKSRIDDGLLIDSRMLANPDANIWENSGKFQGDILLTDDQIEDIVADYAGNRAAYVRPNARWPGGVVPFEFGANEFNAAQQNAILRSIQYVERFSCVRFRRRAASDRNFLRITGRPTGCYAQVGFGVNNGAHTLNVARANPGQGCLHNIVIIHELLHSLGFFHMHSAYERYNYVRINWNNIQRGAAFAFYRMPRNLVNLLGAPYEYQSCMHYSTHAFSTNGLPTIVATRSFPGVMGHMRYVTHLDWVRLRRHYNCPGAWSDEETELLKEEVEKAIPYMEQGLPLPGMEDFVEENNEPQDMEDIVEENNEPQGMEEVNE